MAVCLPIAHDVRLGQSMLDLLALDCWETTSHFTCAGRQQRLLRVIFSCMDGASPQF
jgi:hypothetical protein